jgi:hypothetical protein
MCQHDASKSMAQCTLDKAPEHSVTKWHGATVGHSVNLWQLIEMENWIKWAA